MSTIDKLDVFTYDVRYRHGEYMMSGGRGATHQEGTVVRLTDSDGETGWGEIVPLGGTYLPAFPGGIRAAYPVLQGAVLGLDVDRPRTVSAAMDEVLLEQRAAKSAVDVALWDLRGKKLGIPVSSLMGGMVHDDFPLYEAVPLASPEEMVTFVRARLEEGIRSFQLKVGNEPELDAARTIAVADAVPDDVRIIADSNGGWDVQAAIKATRTIGERNVYLEQPCRSLEDNILVSRHARQPLILDECILTLDDLYRAKYEAGVVAINIKLSRVGGLTKALQMRDAAQDLGLKTSMEDMWGGDLTSAAVAHLACTTSSRALWNVSFFNDWTDGHLCGYQPRSVAGRGAAPTGPGLGVQVDESKLTPLYSFARV